MDSSSHIPGLKPSWRSRARWDVNPPQLPPCSALVPQQWRLKELGCWGFGGLESLPTLCQVGCFEQGVPVLCCAVLCCLTRVMCCALISFGAVMKSENHRQLPGAAFRCGSLDMSLPRGARPATLRHHGPKEHPAAEPGEGPRQEAQPRRVCRGVFGEFTQGLARRFSAFRWEWLRHLSNL